MMRARRWIGGLLTLGALTATGCLLTSFEIGEPPMAGGSGGVGGMSAGMGGMIVAGMGGMVVAGTGGEPAAPVLQDDEYAILQGEALTVLPASGLLANDSPPGLEITSWTVVDVPEAFKGNVEIEKAGNFKFAPVPGFFGTYRVRYTAAIGGREAQAEVRFRVVPRRIALDDVVAGIGGFVLYGDAADALGVSLDGLGDVDHDGKADLIIGAPGSRAGAGAVYLVHGKDDFEPIELELLPRRTSERRFMSLAGAEDDAAGVSVSGIGDLDGDGSPDFVVGANLANVESGRAYVVRTGDLPQGGELEVDSHRILLGDAANKDVGRVVAGVGDVNGDGNVDVLVSSDHVDYGWIHVVSGAYLLGDEEPPFSAPLSEAAALHLRADKAEDHFPVAASAVGDIDDDGYDEVFVASYSSFLLLLGGTMYPAHAGEPGPDGSSGGWSLLRGESPMTASVTRAGDVDGDGVPDVAYCDGTVLCRVVFGPPSTLASGWDVVGFAPDARYLLAAGGGDVDGDGYSDLLFADDRAAYVVYGKPTGHSEVRVNSLSDAGYSIRAASDGNITAVDIVGDVNGDGIDDLAIGDASADSGAGRVYVIFGVQSHLRSGD